ncbi:MAG: CPBP family intramembrane metalloprotease [Planctomycetota bacterium]|nr:MAG: CPBP family intramembrane metalloprotease [Planctomycetota bacterium]
MNTSVGVVRLAVMLEGGLAVVAAALAWWLDVPILPRLRPTWAAVARGCLATLPMLAALAWLARSQWPPIAGLRRKVTPLVADLFQDAGPTALAVVAAAAGVGEELLFRGAMQPLAERWLGHEAAALIAVSLLFGTLHALTPTYFVLATIVGGYFGWLTQRYDDLTAPIVAHAVYDFVALFVLRSRLGDVTGGPIAAQRPESR